MNTNSIARLSLDPYFRAKETEDYYRCLSLARLSHGFEHILVLEDDAELEEGGLLRLAQFVEATKKVQVKEKDQNYS